MTKRKDYLAPLFTVHGLRTEAVCVAVSNTGQDGTDAMGKRNDFLWEDDEDDTPAQNPTN